MEGRGVFRSGKWRFGISLTKTSFSVELHPSISGEERVVSELIKRLKAACDAAPSEVIAVVHQADLQEAITALEAMPVWVKCSERMPETDCDVAFIADIWEHSIHYEGMHGMVLGGRFRSGDLGGRFSIPGHCMNASHWMALPPPPICAHKWIDARNAVVESGEICLKCNSMRAGNQPTTQSDGG
jgi:hypothetical protein